MDVFKYTRPTALESSPLDSLPMLYFTDESFNMSERVARVEAYRQAYQGTGRGKFYTVARASIDLAMAATWEALTVANALGACLLAANATEGGPAQGVAAVGSGFAAYFGTRLIGFGLTKARRRKEMRSLSDEVLAYEASR